MKKDLLTQINSELFQEKSRQERLFNYFPTIVIFEGSKASIARGDLPESQSSTGDFLSAQSGFTIQWDEFESLTLSDVKQRIAVALDEIIKQKALKLLELIEDGGRNKIQVNSAAEGREAVLKLLGERDIDFDRNGNPILPPLFMHPDSFRKLTEEESKIDDSEFKRLQQEIFIQKREEWRVRESNRKLVG